MPTDKTYWKPDRVVYRRKPKKKRALLNRSRLILVGVIAVIGLGYWGLYAFLHLSYFRIQSIEVRGTETLSADSVKNFIDSRIAGERWLTVPRNNILFFSLSSVENSLRQEFPAIAEVKVKKVFPGIITADVAERSLWAIYCFRQRPVVSTTTAPVIGDSAASCYFMDKTGVIFGDAPETQGTLILKITSDRGGNSSLGAHIFESSDVQTFDQLIKIFGDDASLTVAGFELRKNAPNDVWLISQEGFSVIITREASF
ncbi:MAG: FtsQ-type POTRA domain-containing protein, partial [Candidatus Sungbacteria bacterium]|nr:FtsQ-type POTRA domain-containing protein [Candidatus Sungbacteria bacterium]